MRLAFFGSSLVSAYWNGAATYYRGLLKALHQRGHSVSFLEPDAFERQQHRDLADPPWAKVVVYQPTLCGMENALLQAAKWADVLIKCSGVGVLDRELEEAVAALRGAHRSVILWDVDAPATLESLAADSKDPLRALIPRYDAVLTYGGGDAVVRSYEALGARLCAPIYNALDRETHYPVPADRRYSAEVSFLGNRLPDREARVEEFFFAAARRMPDQGFLLGGSGWGDAFPPNVRYVGHVYTRDHNAFNCSTKVVLNINRDSMARFGASPPTRIFEAAGAAACVISDKWAGIERFLEPNREILLAADGIDVADHAINLSVGEARSIGEAARRRVLAEHTYAHRAAELEKLLVGRDSLRMAG